MSSTFVSQGAVLMGRYRIEQKLGEGGYGVVYAATQQNLGRQVAVKVLHTDVVARAGAVERFEQEAELAQRMTHPNVVRLFDFGRLDSGVPFIVYELLHGRSLEAELSRVGALSAARVTRISEQILKALAEAHHLGIVHRDIKPANIFLCDYAGEPDFVKILDFGIAAMPSGNQRGLTAEGISLGTPAYMSPEQVLDQAIDGRTDLYAVGLVMSEMLTGKPVYGGATAMRVALAQIEAAPVPLPQHVLGSPLGATIRTATQKSKEARPTSALAMLEQLRAATTANYAIATGPTRVPNETQPSAGQHDTRQSNVATTQPSYQQAAFDPTAGLPTPAAGVPAMGGMGAMQAGHPVVSGQHSVGALVVGHSGPSPTVQASHKTPALLWIAVVGALLVGVGGVGFGVFALSQSNGKTSTTSSDKKKSSKAKAADESDESDESDETDEDFDVDIGSLLKDPSRGTMAGVDFEVLDCTRASHEMVAISVNGTDGKEMYQRVAAAGYQCMSITRVRMSGQTGYSAMFTGAGAATMVFHLRDRGMNPYSEKLVVDAKSGASVGFMGKSAQVGVDLAFAKKPPANPATP